MMSAVQQQRRSYLGYFGFIFAHWAKDVERYSSQLVSIKQTRHSPEMMVISLRSLFCSELHTFTDRKAIPIVSAVKEEEMCIIAAYIYKTLRLAVAERLRNESKEAATF